MSQSLRFCYNSCLLLLFVGGVPKIYNYTHTGEGEKKQINVHANFKVTKKIDCPD